MSLNKFYTYVEKKKGEGFLIPKLDDRYGNPSSAKILFFLESPGPQVRVSRKISLDNPDQSAKNLRSQLVDASAPLQDIALWNIVPWLRKRGAGFDKPSLATIKEAREYHQHLFKLLPQLTTLVFVGCYARADIVYYCSNTNYRILAAHHPASRAMAVRGRREQNIAVFKKLGDANLCEKKC